MIVTMDPNRLWAKSMPWGVHVPTRSMYLPGHLEDVFHAAEKVVDATADDQLRAFGLQTSEYRDRFRRCVLLAAAVHDLGKANDHFQGMLLRARERSGRPQGLRHEWVTILMMEAMKSWLIPAVGRSEADWKIVQWAVAGHHPAERHDSPPKSAPDGSGGVDSNSGPVGTIRLYTDRTDFVDCLKWIGATFGLASPPPANREHTRSLVAGDGVFTTLSTWSVESRRLWREIESTNDARLVAAVKNSLIAADVAGSALPKYSDDPGVWNWITDSFAVHPDAEDLNRIVRLRLGERGALRPFQEAIASSAARVSLVKAGCGSGKTLAAYLWAARNHPSRRLYFCYPTTGTATEGFRDYLLQADVEADLFHSRRDVDFEMILHTAGGTESHQSDVVDAEADAVIRVDTLDAWSTPIVACTVDAVLGVIQNHRRGLYAWPALAGSAFVFDEIHAYDDCLFGALIRFTRDLPNIPVLLMTASLPDSREQALREAVETADGSNWKVISGPADLEMLPRYHKEAVSSVQLVDRIAAEVRAGGKVLWVCNTVNRAMEAAERAEMVGLKPLLYHNRFKYIDRVCRHESVIRAFSPDVSAGVLAITTQVCEMSLDLKGCTLLVTDKCPISALIQRLGRLNRQAAWVPALTAEEQRVLELGGALPKERLEGCVTRPFIVLEIEGSARPYEVEDLVATDDWLARLNERNITQVDLIKAWFSGSSTTNEVRGSTWLDGGPQTLVKELRELSAGGISVLMEEDEQQVRTNPKLRGKYILPMLPTQLPWKSWPRFQGIPIAPCGSIHYCPLRGAAWNPQFRETSTCT